MTLCIPLAPLPAAAVQQASRAPASAQPAWPGSSKDRSGPWLRNATIITVANVNLRDFANARLSHVAALTSHSMSTLMPRFARPKLESASQHGRQEYVSLVRRSVHGV